MFMDVRPRWDGVGYGDPIRQEANRVVGEALADYAVRFGEMEIDPALAALLVLIEYRIDEALCCVVEHAN